MRGDFRAALTGLLAAASLVCGADESAKAVPASPQGKEMRYICKDGEPREGAV